MKYFSMYVEGLVFYTSDSTYKSIWTSRHQARSHPPDPHDQGSSLYYHLRVLPVMHRAVPMMRFHSQSSSGARRLKAHTRALRPRR